VARQRRNFEQAKGLCEKALYCTEKLDYRDGIADSSYELAQTELEIEQKNSARKNFERAYSIYKALGWRKELMKLKLSCQIWRTKMSNNPTDQDIEFMYLAVRLAKDAQKTKSSYWCRDNP